MATIVQKAVENVAHHSVELFSTARRIYMTKESHYLNKQEEDGRL